MKTIDEAREVMRLELRALQATMRGLDRRFEQAMRLLKKRDGKIVVTGVGKSGLIGQKLAATFSSTGSPAVFMHAADGIHGDLGIVGADDVVLALSHSGESEEILAILTPIHRIGAKIIALVGDDKSRLARMSDAVVILAVPKEADHLNLAPTSSALAALSVGDAMAALLSKWRKFRPEDYALYHPGGQIGRRLLLRVRDLMHDLSETKQLTPSATFEEVIEGLTQTVPGAGHLGAVLILRSKRDRRLAGIITDGDMRKAMFERRGKAFDLTARDLMCRRPTTIGPEAKAEEALRLMEDRPSQIKELPVVDAKGKTLGLLRLHDLLQIGFRSNED
jgi:arabinose-5-phosphate isomerase